MTAKRVVVVGASVGGLAALKTLVGSLPPDMDAAVLIVMHIGSWDSVLPQLLQKKTALRVADTRDGEAVLPSTVYVAPPDRHMLIHQTRVRLSHGPKENFARPAIDPLFRSAAVEYRSRAIGVVLTGDLDDGAAGLRAITAAGGVAMVQDPADCVAPSMPRSALRATRVDVIAPIDRLGDAIVAAVKAPAPENPTMEHSTDKAALESRIALGLRSEPADLDAIGKRSALTCPECGGILWRLDDGEPLRFRCHTGHAFSELSLAHAQKDGTEDALWASIRRLQERVVLLREALAHSEKHGDGSVAPLRASLQRLESAVSAVRSIAQTAAEID
ncbi:chemotaxis protein CheB [Paraburkholderia terricola]|uniref:chemotaxis protein CheB n=1 Tax=Paraburkholderia terricola TaxID=169427 RepID=UPI0009F1B775|nr:chemotaxis protein CheB [Paraburkholderia terricola]ORC51757.1 hypothetical protein B2G74_03475 [Burkholderia sp. A27]